MYQAPKLGVRTTREFVLQVDQNGFTLGHALGDFAFDGGDGVLDVRSRHFGDSDGTTAGLPDGGSGGVRLSHGGLLLVNQIGIRRFQRGCQIFSWGDSSVVEHCFRKAGTGVRFSVTPRENIRNTGNPWSDIRNTGYFSARKTPFRATR
jgi:hypothetical protein